MKKLFILFILLFTITSTHLQAQTLDSFSIIRTTQPYRFYARIKLPNDGYKFSRFIERNLQSVQNTQIFSYLFKDCPPTGNTPVYYDTTINILVTQYTKLFEVMVNIHLDENMSPPCTIRPGMQKTDSLYFTGDQVMSIEDPADAAISIYPNPVRNELQIRSAAAIKQYIITDMTGRILQAGEGADKPLKIALPDGLYLLQLQTTKGILNRRFVVNNN